MNKFWFYVTFVYLKHCSRITFRVQSLFVIASNIGLFSYLIMRVMTYYWRLVTFVFGWAVVEETNYLQFWGWYTVIKYDVSNTWLACIEYGPSNQKVLRIWINDKNFIKSGKFYFTAWDKKFPRDPLEERGKYSPTDGSQKAF